MTATTSETFKRFATSGVDWAVMMEDEERQLVSAFRFYKLVTKLSACFLVYFSCLCTLQCFNLRYHFKLIYKL